jgi:hypoxanthine phosphoribosyltransferase
MHEAGFQPDLVVAISRGGCIPARVICDYLDVFDLDVIKVEHYHGVHKEKTALLKYPLSAEISGKRVLLIDDVSDTGDSFEVGMKHLLARGKPAELKTAALHHKTVSSYTPDFYSEIVREWRWIIYPWAVMEDLRSLLDAMKPPPSTATEFSDYLKQQHDLEVPEACLQDILYLHKQ